MHCTGRSPRLRHNCAVVLLHGQAAGLGPTPFFPVFDFKGQSPPAVLDGGEGGGGGDGHAGGGRGVAVAVLAVAWVWVGAAGT